MSEKLCNQLELRDADYNSEAVVHCPPGAILYPASFQSLLLATVLYFTENYLVQDWIVSLNGFKLNFVLKQFLFKR